MTLLTCWEGEWHQKSPSGSTIRGETATVEAIKQKFGGIRLVKILWVQF